MTKKFDFAQKLLNDLRRRKEQIAAAQTSTQSGFAPADSYGKSRQVLRASKDMKAPKTIDAKIRSRYKSSSDNLKSSATVQAKTQIVPYGGGHKSGNGGEVSMALAYAFDNGGKLKRIDFTGSGKMIDFLQQIGRRSMHQSSNTQWSSTNQFPTLTHLHIDEIAKGAQKLNQILRACSNGMNIDKATVEIGQELWKGAMELEQSLKMLVSLQEASEAMVNPKGKSHLKLLEVAEEEEESTSSTEKQNQIERPVFSFDKTSKNRKSTPQTYPQQKMMALTYLKDDTKPKPEQQASSNSTSEPQASQHINSSKKKNNTGLPNVIAKLMGLEELSDKENPKVIAERGNLSKQKPGETATTGTSKKSFNRAEMKIEKAYVAQGNQNSNQSHKNATLKCHEPGLQQETFRLTYEYNYRGRADSKKTMQSEEGQEGIRNNVNESQAAISKINELQSHDMQLSQNGLSLKDVRKEARFDNAQRKRQDVKGEKATLKTMVPEKNQSSEAADQLQAERLGNLNDQPEKRSSSKSIIAQQKPKEHESLWQLPGHATQGKNLNSEDRSQQRRNNKSELKTIEAKPKRPDSSQGLVSRIRKSQKQTPPKHQNFTKENNSEAMKLTAAKGSSSRGQTKEPVSDFKIVNSEAKQKFPQSLQSESKSSTAGETGALKRPAQITSHMASQSPHVFGKKMVNEIKPPKMASTKMNMKPNEEITIAVQKAKNPARVHKPHISNPQASQTSESKPNPTQEKQGNLRSKAKECQQAEAEQVVTTNNPTTHEMQSPEDIIELQPYEKIQNTKTSKDSNSQHNQEIVPNEVKEVRPQTTTTDINKGGRDISYLQPQEQGFTEMEKAEPLTEDEMHLMQKLITSHLFMNTAEALFKLNIPIGILNYAIDQACQERESRLMLDCGYEVLKRKGRRLETFLHPRASVFMRCEKIRSLEDLVRQLHKDFEALTSYRRNETEEYDDANYILRMLERDIHYRDRDLNCMWDLGWNELTFAHAEIDEVIRDMEHKILDELINEMAEDCISSSNFTAATA